MNKRGSKKVIYMKSHMLNFNSPPSKVPEKTRNCEIVPIQNSESIAYHKSCFMCVFCTSSHDPF